MNTYTEKITEEISVEPPNQDMIDYALKCGSNEPQSLERIVSQFQKNKGIAKNAEFLRNEFGADGRGYIYTDDKFSRAALVAAWFDGDGITLAVNNTAFPKNQKNVHIDWEQAAVRIGELIENGEYCSQDIIDRAADNDMKDIAYGLWFLHQDLSDDYRDKYFIPDEMFKGGFLDSTERIKASLTEPETLQKYADGLSDFVKQYEENRDILRFIFHKPRKLLSRLKDLKLKRKDFITRSDFSFNPQYFITEDEKDHILLNSRQTEKSKLRIDEYFRQEHTKNEKIAFLKKEYGTGGTGRPGFNEWHDAKGISYKKGSLSTPDCEVLMKWSEVSERIDKLIAVNRYITQDEIDKRVQNKP